MKGQRLIERGDGWRFVFTKVKEDGANIWEVEVTSPDRDTTLVYRKWLPSAAFAALRVSERRRGRGHREES